MLRSSLLNAAIQPFVETTEAFFIQFVQFILLLLYAAAFGADDLPLTLALFLQLLNDADRQGICQPKSDEEHRPFGVPVRKFTAVKIVHNCLTKFISSLCEMNFAVRYKPYRALTLSSISFSTLIISSVTDIVSSRALL